jgi:predicted dehydrogenase
MARKYGIGVIGLRMGVLMLEINTAAFQSEVRAVCDLSDDRLRDAGDKYHIPFATQDYRELVKRSDIDIVAIYAPDRLHLQMIEEAFKAGKHVIVTKPMVNSLEEAKAAVDLVKAFGLKLLVGQTRRYEPRHMQAKALYDSGKIGKALMAEAHYIHGDFWKVLDRGAWRYEDPKDFLYGSACHPIDHLRWYFGDVDEVFAYGCTSPFDARYPQDRESNFIVNMKFQNGVIARMMTAMGVVEPPYGSQSDVMPCEGFNVWGTNGTITNYHARYFENGDKEKSVTVDFERGAVDFDGKKYSGHQISVLNYVREMEACLEEDRPPAIDVVSGAKTIAVSAACWESIKTGQPAKVFNAF